MHVPATAFEGRENKVAQLGLHVPRGVENVALLHNIDKLAEAVYPAAHVGVQTVTLLRFNSKEEV